MTALNVIEFHKPILGELKPAAFSLSVPMADDAIQVGIPAGAGAPMGCLSVLVGEGLLRLNHENGQPLQIDIYDKPSERRGRIRLLARPISELTLRNSITSEGIWLAEGDGLEVTDLKRFDRFLTQIFIFAYRRQNPEATIAQIMEIFDKHQDF